MKLGLGTAQIGLEYGIFNRTGKPDPNTALDMLSYAVRQGINCFDTAVAYGDSEEIIGGYISSHPNKLLKISTKVKSPTEIKNVMSRLNITGLNYCLLHNITDLNPVSLEMFSELVRKRIIHKFGVSVYTPGDIRRCLEYDEIQVIQIPFNVLDSRLRNSLLMERLKERGVEIHARSVYLQGLLLMDKAPDYLREANKYLEEYDDLTKNLSLTRAEAAILYVRDNPYIDRFFIGCETKAQITEAVRINAMPPLNKDAIKAFDDAFEHVPEKILNPTLWKE